MNCEEEREKRNTHTHKETKTEKGTDQGKVGNEIKAPDLEQFSCNWKNFDRRRVRESAISAKKQISLRQKTGTTSTKNELRKNGMEQSPQTNM